MKFLSLSLSLLPAFVAFSAFGNLVPGDSSFETGYGVWKKAGTIDAKVAWDGEKSLKTNQPLTTTTIFVFEPGKKYFFSVYLKAEKPETAVTLTAYRANWMGGNIVATIKVGTAWTRAVLPIPEQSIDTYNEVWLMINPRGRSVWVDACQLEAGALTAYAAAVPLVAACEVLSPVFGNLFFPDENVRIKVEYYNATARDNPFTGFLEVTDYYGNKVFDWREPRILLAKKSLAATLALPALKKGFYHVRYGAASEGGETVSETASFCVIDKPLPFSKSEGSLFGVCGGPDDKIPACARMGAKWFPVDVRWAYETAPGRLGDMTAIEATIDKARANGVNPVIYLRRTPDWAAVKKHPHNIYPPESKYLKAYEDFVFRIVTRFKDKVWLWQLWGGETDLSRDHVANELGKSEAWFIDILTKMYKAGYLGAKRADPTCVVATGAVSGVDCENGRFPFARKVLREVNGFYDEFTVHPYCYPSFFGKNMTAQSPEEHQLDKIYRAARELSGKDIWNGEYGFAIAPSEPLNGTASKRMAEYMVRSYLLTAVEPSVKRLMWYTIAGDHDVYSIWRGPNPRPLVAAYSALARILTGCSAPRKIPMGAYIEAYTFARKNGSAAAMWVPENKEINLAIPTLKGVRVIDIMGNEIAVGATLGLSGSPVYLVATDMTPVELGKTLGESKLFLAPAKAEIRVHSLKVIKVYLTNQLNKALDGKLIIDAPLKGGKTRTIEKTFSRARPGVSETITLPLPEELDIAALNARPITGKVETTEGPVALRQTLDLIACERTRGEIKIDGNLDEWRNRPAIELKTVNHLFPPDAASHGLWTGESDLSVKAYVGWDKAYFYFAAAVTDDTSRDDQDILTLWKGDCAQLAFDCLNESLSPGLKENDREFTVGYSAKAGRAATLRDWPLPPSELETALTAVRRDGKQVVYEVAVPFAELAPARPEPGQAFGFNFVALDRDNKKVDYWMGLTYGICGGKNTAIFKKFILTE